MGYKITTRQTVALDGQWEGVEITFRQFPLAEFIELSREWEALNKDDSNESARFALELVQRVVEGWNLEDEDGKPIPANEKGWARVPAALALAIVDAWNKQAQLPNPSSAAS
jgi:hypothetical protein